MATPIKLAPKGSAVSSPPDGNAARPGKAADLKNGCLRYLASPTNLARLNSARIGRFTNSTHS